MDPGSSFIITKSRYKAKLPSNPGALPLREFQYDAQAGIPELKSRNKLGGGGAGEV